MLQGRLGLFCAAARALMSAGTALISLRVSPSHGSHYLYFHYRTNRSVATR
jgi:hypothetical protein